MLLLAGCGAATGDGAAQVGETLAPIDAATTVDGHASPSTTVPVRLEDRGCQGRPVEVAERILIERRRGVATPSCLPAGQTAVGAAEGSCWTSCPDGRVFVDFDLDTTRAPAATPSNGTEDISVPFAARYSDGHGTTTAAELVVLRQSSAGGAWEIVGLVEVDVEAEIDAARAAMSRFLDAVGHGDYAGAAAVMVGDGSVGTSGRDDLGRLVDEGMLSGTGSADIAVGLGRWCASGAACTVQPTLEFEVTAAHTVRIIATYELSNGTYETTFAFADGVLEGLPVKVS